VPKVSQPSFIFQSSRPTLWLTTQFCSNEYSASSNTREFCSIIFLGLNQLYSNPTSENSAPLSWICSSLFCCSSSKAISHPFLINWYLQLRIERERKWKKNWIFVTVCLPYTCSSSTFFCSICFSTITCLIVA